MQIKTSQMKQHIQWSLRRTQIQSFCTPPCGIRVHPPPGPSLCSAELQCSELLVGFHYKGITDWIIGQVSTGSPAPLPVEARLAQSPNPLISWLVFLVTSPHPGSSHLVASTHMWSQGLMSNKDTPLSGEIPNPWNQGQRPNSLLQQSPFIHGFPFCSFSYPWLTMVWKY